MNRRKSLREPIKCTGIGVLTAMLLMSVAGCPLDGDGDYDIHVSNTTSFPATISLDGVQVLALPAGTHDVISGVDRSAHELEANLQVQGQPASLDLEIPAVPDGAVVAVCLILTEGGLQMQPPGAADCDFGPLAPPASAAFSALDRVPVNQTRQIAVTLLSKPQSPAPSLVLTIRRVAGTAGEAEFQNGEQTLTISQSTTVEIRGTANSDVAHNMELDATLDGVPLPSVPFTVRTWPSGMRRVNFLPNNPAAGVLGVQYLVDSESGNPNDLRKEGLLFGECVDYTTPAGTLCMSNTQVQPCLHPVQSPPFQAGYCDPNLLVNLLVVGNPLTDPCEPSPPPVYLGNGTFLDHHHVPTTPSYCVNQLTGFTAPPYAPYDGQAGQYYGFQDPLLQTSPQWIYGPNLIQRTVLNASGSWSYTIEKTEPDGQGGTVVLSLP